MRIPTATALGALSLTAVAALFTTGTAVADSHGGRDVGAVTFGKHTYAPSTASYNWGGHNWNSKVVFGDMILD
ncbi:hypothetical protein [Streptomyces sp. NPDC052496]|uniref:hypothetical protein n=1 Tax=Streptomyces sp. NPDC052496 TaxID=3154951 RepID=UPI00342FB3C4